MTETIRPDGWNESDFQMVLSIFEQISSIPRCSKNEEQIAAWLEKFGKDRGFETKRDHCNNVLISVPASAGMDNLPAVILQAHTDMVCEKESGTNHNFTADPLKLQYFKEEGISWLTAENTTLGADNGIGMAYMLAAAASDSIAHPPLKLLFTTDEEIGLTGAQGMDSDFVSGEYMINLDSEEEGTIIVGCAGGTQICFKHLVDVENAYDSDDSDDIGGSSSIDSAADSVVDLVVASDDDSVPAKPYTIVVSGLLGGHSGTDIHIGRGNANLILIQFFKRLTERYTQNVIKLIKIKGGTAANTIPRRAELSFVTDIPADSLRAEVADYVMLISSVPSFNDPNVSVEVADADLSNIKKSGLKSFSAKNTGRILNFLIAIPNGVFEMSASIPDLVLTSGNLAIIKTRSNAEYFKGAEKEAESSDLDIYTEKSKRELEIIYSLRSGNELRLKEKIKEMMALSEKHHFNFEITHTYSPWEPDFNSEFLKNCAEIYRKTFGNDVRISAIHAGLECGVFHRQFPSMKMISIGPDITAAHTPGEKLNLDAAEKVWIYLKEILKSFGEMPQSDGNVTE
ncbi:Cytosol non-specific dipeptidase [Methanimicrococcus sp. At1]|uniref:Cytosol non-specific dipeptidase n=1 Tax=Methanimicrococcus hacksteinii TaxID=3028293 RepID=A0ABU3VNM3_9EURY|nr:M20/M25/M40 family metallo-hydrolase [Methanimicrococcus sp. At1]MDV0445004.1 Cytosol non-specific dipeptidase [Methanimicrococcus sp. At1]